VATTESAKKIADLKKQTTNKINFLIETSQKKAYLIKADYNLEVPQPRIKLLFADLYLTVAIGDLWTDIKTTGLDSEGGVDFKKSKKPEALIKRIITMNSEKSDFILDSFLGSGTTAAVAHKMGRKWIGIELGDHANTHCLPRLKSVVDGIDQSGVSKAVNWKGGGGFKFYNLAPSLLRKDSFGNFVIDEKYNANMLAAAMCKHEGFKYSPDETLYWKQGKSTETDYIFVTTGFVTIEQLDSIHAQMKENDSLLICAKSYAPGCEKHFANITVKKIPQMILGKCEFGKDNYDLNIIKATEEEAEESNEVQDER
jgi:adenine-specific DNA-methyltransferase